MPRFGSGVSIYLPLALWLLPALASMPAAALPPAADRYDGRALQLLHTMFETYAGLPALDEHTEFYSATIPLQPAPKSERNGSAAQNEAGPAADASSDPSAPQGKKLNRSLRLLVARPNRLRMELREPDLDHTGKMLLSEWVCDGKSFWTYSQGRSLTEGVTGDFYTRDKAPSQLSGFQKMAGLTTGSLEVMMLIGVDPFAQVRTQVDSVQVAGTEVVRGVETDVVTLQTAGPAETTQVRCCIGRQDHLLHRLVVETRPVGPPPNPAIVGDEFDALINSAPGAAPAQAVDDPSRQITRLILDNEIELPTAMNPDDFQFRAPDGAMLYQPFDMNSELHAGKRYDLNELVRMYGAQRRRKLRVVRPK